MEYKGAWKRRLLPEPGNCPVSDPQLNFTNHKWDKWSKRPRIYKLDWSRVRQDVLWPLITPAVVKINKFQKEWPWEQSTEEWNKFMSDLVINAGQTKNSGQGLSEVPFPI